MTSKKQAVFIGSAKKDLADLPAEARQKIGVELLVVQFGGEPSDFKPMPSVGSGAYEIRVKDENGIYRAFYVAKFDEAIYVLHAFQKKSQQTAKEDIELGRKRYQDMLRARKERGP